jgi:hypothetical protein
MIDLLSSLEGTSPADFRAALLSILVAFVLCQMVAACYAWTHGGLSYSRSFVHSLVLGGLVAAVLMLAIGNNLVWGVGIVGTLAIIRFRTNLRDPRDMVFVFAAMAVGIAAGVRAHAVGLIGAIAFCAAAVYLDRTGFASRNHFDGILRLTLPVEAAGNADVELALRTHCASFSLASMQQVADGQQAERAYQIRLLYPESRDRLIAGLARIAGVTDISLLIQDTQTDV